MVLRSFACLNSGARRFLFISLACLSVIYFYRTLEGLRPGDGSSKTIPAGSDPNHQNPGAKIGAQPDDKENVAFCLAVKDQSQDLPEFLIHHYHHHGIRRFYIMDDRSQPPLSNFSDYGIPLSAITFKYNEIPLDTQWMQYAIYNECAKLYGSRHRWLAFIDADEFFETKSNETLPSILKEFDQDDSVGALGVNWRIHTSSGLLTRPASARKSFTTCIEDDNGNTTTSRFKDNKLIKSIVKSSSYSSPVNPHKFYLKDGSQTVGEHGDVIKDPAVRVPITRDRITLHHYAIKSRQEFEEKMKRSNAMGQAKGWDYWDHLEGLPQLECKEMTMYEP
jgi:hypothetical protein